MQSEGRGVNALLYIVIPGFFLIRALRIRYPLFYTDTVLVHNRSPKCSTPFGIKDSCGPGRFGVSLCVVCSTPFGIKDSCGPGAVAVDVATKVLNAFRHQRFLRRVSQRSSCCVVQTCSTPFGIKDSCGPTA